MAHCRRVSINGNTQQYNNTIIIHRRAVISLSCSISGVVELLPNVSNPARGHWARDAFSRSIELVFNDNYCAHLAVDRRTYAVTRLVYQQDTKMTFFFLILRTLIIFHNTRYSLEKKKIFFHFYFLFGYYYCY